jgi:hypothetical protein
MKTYKIATIHGEKTIIVEDFQCEQDALDKMVDQMEENGDEYAFLTDEDLVDYYEDEYIIAGNHGRILYHGGHLTITSI